jgi:hypothetical protein
VGHHLSAVQCRLSVHAFLLETGQSNRMKLLLVSSCLGTLDRNHLPDSPNLPSSRKAFSFQQDMNREEDSDAKEKYEQNRDRRWRIAESH